MKNIGNQNTQDRDPVAHANMKQRPDRGFIYLVLNPSSIEIVVCASPKRLQRGRKVIAPTRYGLDYGVIVGSACPLARYEPGSVNPQGACLHSIASRVPVDPDEDLVAAADPEDLQIEPVSIGAEELSQKTVSDVVQEDLSDFPESGCADQAEEVPVAIDGEIDWIERIATADDETKVREFVQLEDEALRICREKVVRHGLDMKLVTAHYLFGEPKIIFFFTAATRVDFRELVKDLVSVFRVRIELRQIGVRDESRVLGGLAVCGRDFCCHCVTDKLNPVSIKMAKEQNLSLNSTKISGPCGRLLCCLSYEYDFYYEEKQKLPPEGSKLKVRQDLMRVSEVNLLSKKISLTGPEGRFLTIPFEAVGYNEDTSRWEIDKQYLNEIFSI